MQVDQASRTNSNGETTLRKWCQPVIIMNSTKEMMELALEKVHQYELQKFPRFKLNKHEQAWSSIDFVMLSHCTFNKCRLLLNGIFQHSAQARTREEASTPGYIMNKWITSNNNSKRYFEYE